MEKALKKFLGSCFIFLTLALSAEVPAILISDHAAPQERTAAGELADYIFKITGKRPPVMAENSWTAQNSLRTNGSCKAGEII